MSDKVKVGDIAKKYGLTAKAILLMVKGMGHDDIKSHNSVLGDDVLAKIEKRFEHDKRQAKDDIKNKDRLVAMNKTSGSESHGDPKEQVAPSSGVADKESLDHAREVKIAEKQVEKKVEEGQPKPENDSSKNQKDTKKHGKKGRFFNKKREVVVDDKLVDSNIKKTLNKVVKPGSRRKYRKEREEELRQKYMELNKYMQEVYGPRGRLEQKRSQLAEPILKRIREVIGELAREERFDMILDSGVGVVLYGNPSFDLTQRVINELNAKR